MLGVRLSSLIKGEALRFEDVQPLHMELMETSTGEIVNQALKTAEKRIGTFTGFCSDLGSDLSAGIRLFQQDALKEGRNVRFVHDICHKLALLMKARLQERAEWTNFTSKAASSKLILQLTDLSFLTSPNQRGKSRYMNMEELANWSADMLVFINALELAKTHKKTSLDNQDDASYENQSNESVCYVVESLKKLSEWFEQEAENKIEYEKAIKELGWITEYSSLIQDIREMTLVSGIVRHKIRTEWVTKNTHSKLEQELEKLPLGLEACQFCGDILDFFKESTSDFNEDEIALGSSEIIESVYGKLKNLMDENSKQGFTSYVLSAAACLGTLNLNSVDEALGKTTNKQVLEWERKNVKKSQYTRRRRWRSWCRSIVAKITNVDSSKLKWDINIPEAQRGEG